MFKEQKMFFTFSPFFLQEKFSCSDFPLRDDDDEMRKVGFGLPYDKVEFVDTTVCILGWANTNPPSTIIDRHCDRQR